MRKLQRIYNAFRRGFWQAWMEVPPQEMRGSKIVCGEISIDTRQAEIDVDRLVEKLLAAEKVAGRVNVG